LFEALERIEEPVIFFVGDLRPVLYVIKVVMMPDLAAQFVDVILRCIRRKSIEI
jgi:hypothetical protein